MSVMQNGELRILNQPMNNCLLTIDFEDFKHDLKRFLSFKDTSGSPEGLLKATKRLDKILKKKQR